MWQLTFTLLVKTSIPGNGTFFSSLARELLTYAYNLHNYSSNHIFQANEHKSGIKYKRKYFFFYTFKPGSKYNLI